MKKSLFTILMCMLLSTPSIYAQPKPHTFSITPKVGLNVSNLTGKAPMCISYVYYEEYEDYFEHIYAGSYTFTPHSVRFGFTGGVAFDYQLNKRLGLSVEALYSQQGANYDDLIGIIDTDDGELLGKMSYTDITANLQCINVPILVKYYVWKSLAVEAGIQPAYISSKLKCNVEVDSSLGDDMRFDNTIQYLSKFDIAVPVGVSYEFRNIVVDARYAIGVTNLYTEKLDPYSKEGKENTHNSVFSITLGYKFSL